jgi:hypothetical protein
MKYMRPVKGIFNGLKGILKGWKGMFKGELKPAKLPEPTELPEPAKLPELGESTEMHEIFEEMENSSSSEIEEIKTKDGELSAIEFEGAEGIPCSSSPRQFQFSTEFVNSVRGIIPTLLIRYGCHNDRIYYLKRLVVMTLKFEVCSTSYLIHNLNWSFNIINLIYSCAIQICQVYINSNFNSLYNFRIVCILKYIFYKKLDE